MPVLYEIDPAIGQIHTRCIGELTLDEVLEHFVTLTNDPTCPDRLDVLLDLTTMTSLPNPLQLRTVTSKIGEVSRNVRFDACAIVAKRTALFGMMRMFEVFAESRFGAMRVFDDEGPAVEWLESQRAERTGS